MNVTRLYWGGVSTGAVLLGGAVLFGQPLLLGGGVAVFGWLLARQVRFARAMRRVVASATVDQVPAQDRTAVDEPLPVVVSVSLARPSPLDVVVDLNVPPAARCVSPDGPAAVVTLDAGATDGTGETTVVWDVAGRDRLRRPLATFRDRAGLFVATTAVGTERPVHVGTPRVSRVSVGRTGRDLLEGSDTQVSTGLLRTVEPDRIREFATGDSARHIDWRATARFGDLYVREYEREANRSVCLVVDTRATMLQGPVGRTKLDYVRHFSLSTCELFESRRLPVGLWLFDETGPTARIEPQTRARSGDGSVRSALESLGDGSRETDGPLAGDGTGRSHGVRSPRVVAETARALADESAFATRLRPFFEPSRRRSRPADVGPLYQAVRASRAESRGRVVTVVFTDDSHGAELVEAVTAATHDRGEVVVFLTPSVLFDGGVLSDPDAAYREFVRFEQFRRSIDAYPGVTVYELGPGETLASILSSAPGARRRQRPSETGSGSTGRGDSRDASEASGGTAPRNVARVEAADD